MESEIKKYNINPRLIIQRELCAYNQILVSIAHIEKFMKTNYKNISFSLDDATLDFYDYFWELCKLDHHIIFRAENKNGAVKEWSVESLIRARCKLCKKTTQCAWINDKYCKSCLMNILHNLVNNF